jgi:hypothetical protein
MLAVMLVTDVASAAMGIKNKSPPSATDALRRTVFIFIKDSSLVWFASLYTQADAGMVQATAIAK